MSVHSKKMYISGPMTGFPNQNHDLFNKIAKLIKERYKIEYFSPAENFDGELGLPRYAYMLEDIRGLIYCDSIVMLEGWEKSKGARLELEIAKEINLIWHLLIFPSLLA